MRLKNLERIKSILDTYDGEINIHGNQSKLEDKVHSIYINIYNNI